MSDDPTVHSYLMPNIRVLHVEDSRTDTILIHSILKNIRTHKFNVAAVESLADAIQEVKKNRPDVILLDLTVKDSSGIDTVVRMRDAAPLIPIVITTGNDSQLLVQTAMRKGAQDYLFKNSINQETLNRAICNAIDRKIAANENNEKRLLLETIMGSVVISYWDWNIKHTSMQISAGLREKLGYSENEFESSPSTLQALMHPDDRERVIHHFKEHIESHGEVPYEYIVRFNHKDGSYISVGCRGAAVEWDSNGNAARMVGCYIDYTMFDRYREDISVIRDD